MFYIAAGWKRSVNGTEEVSIQVAVDGDGHGIAQSAKVEGRLSCPTKLTVRDGMTSMVGSVRDATPHRYCPEGERLTLIWKGLCFHDNEGGPEERIPRSSFVMQLFALKTKPARLVSLFGTCSRLVSASSEYFTTVAFGEDGALLTHTGRSSRSLNDAENDEEPADLQIQAHQGNQRLTFDGIVVKTSASHKFCGSFEGVNLQDSTVADEGAFFFEMADLEVSL